MAREALDISGSGQLRGKTLAEPASGTTVTTSGKNGRRFGGNGSGLVEPLQGADRMEPPTTQNRPSQYPDDAYIDSCYSRLIELRDSSATRDELRNGLSALLEDMAKHSGSYSAMVDNLLMKHWLEKRDNGLVAYDEHMKEHVEVIKTLFKAWTRDRYLNLPKVRIFDASCGSGKVLEAFLDTLPPEVLARVQVVANDVSSASLDAARQTLKRFEGRVRIEYTRYDITKELPPRQFDVVIFSQTLPFIVDERTLRDQRLGRTLRKDEDRHLTAKTTVMRALLKKVVKPESGELLIIDEDPMKLSDPPDDVDGLIERKLFKEIFREVSETQMVDKMKEITHARFLGHLKSSIDRKHDMYLMAYTKMAKKSAEARRQQEASKEEVALRNMEDEMRIIHAMEKMHPVLVQRLEKFDGNGTPQYKAVDSGPRLIIDPAYYDSKIRDMPSYWKKNGSNSMVVIKGMMHELGVQQYSRLIDNIKASRKAEPGAAFLFIDRYPAPDESNEPVGNTKARTRLMNSYNDHMFAASIRSGHTYGYLYFIRHVESEMHEEEPSSERGIGARAAEEGDK